MQAALASLLVDARRTGMPAAVIQSVAATVRTEGGQWPEADAAAHSSLEALRLADPAAMSGCWNPGCAAVLLPAAYLRALGDCACVF